MQNQQDASDRDSLTHPDNNVNESFDLSDWIRSEYLRDSTGTSVQGSNDDKPLNSHLQPRVGTETVPTP